MQNSSGNVLFDGKGLWLLNNTNKDLASTAVWINENGIMFGSGNPGDIDATEGEDGYWTWTTAIGHDGISAKAMATNVLSAFDIRGGTIEIGSGFSVDPNGNLTAVNGNFSGKLSGVNLSGDLQGDENAWLVGCGIKVGEDIDGSPKFKVDTDGNVIMKGTITWGTTSSPVKVQYSVDGESDWHDTLKSDDTFARYSYDGGQEWTGALKIRAVDGKDGADGKDGTDGQPGANGRNGSDADVTFNNVNAALGDLFKDVNGQKTTEITDTYIYGQKIKGGEIYGTKIYAGEGGDAFTEMDGSGLNIYNGASNPKISIGCINKDWAYPYISLGIGGSGSGDTYIPGASIIKYGKGLWIGESLGDPPTLGNYPGGLASMDPIQSDRVGIFINFEENKIISYINGSPTSFSSTAVFG